MRRLLAQHHYWPISFGGLQTVLPILIVSLLGLSLTVFPLHSLNAAGVSIHIGTGPVTGLAYRTGGFICRLVNEQKGENSPVCLVEATSGPLYDIGALRTGEVDFAIIGTDTQSLAFTGGGEYMIFGAFRDLRSVFSIYQQPYLVLVKEDSEIATFENLKGRLLYRGQPTSPEFATTDLLADSLEWGDEDLPSALSGADIEAYESQRSEEESDDEVAKKEPEEDRAVEELETTENSEEVDDSILTSELGRLLCEERIDGVVMMNEFPNELSREMATYCGLRAIAPGKETRDAFIEAYPFYVPLTTANLDQTIDTFGTLATLVTSAAMAQDTVYNLVKSVMSQVEQVSGLHPLYRDLHAQGMAQEGNLIPLHRGAKKYFQEEGLR